MEYDWKDRWQDEGAWQSFKGRVRDMWGDLTDDEVEQTEGKLDRLVGAIKEKTGESAEAIERKLKELRS